MRKLLCLIPLLAIGLVGCGDSGPRDATNDPEVQAMLKHVNDEGKPMGGAPAGTPGTGSPTGSAPAPGTPGGAPAGVPGGAPGGTPGGASGSSSGG